MDSNGNRDDLFRICLTIGTSQLTGREARSWAIMIVDIIILVVVVMMMVVWWWW